MSRYRLIHSKLEPATGKVLKTDVRSNRQPKMFFRRMSARTGDRKRSEDGCLLEPATENVRIPDRPCPNIEDNHEARIHELLRILYNQPIYFRPSFESKSSTTQRLSPKLLQTTSSRPWSIVLPFYVLRLGWFIGKRGYIDRRRQISYNQQSNNSNVDQIRN
ncbi:hypothetical protein V8E54_011953 [Elaphomyces granulatus]